MSLSVIRLMWPFRTAGVGQFGQRDACHSRGACQQIPWRGASKPRWSLTILVPYLQGLAPDAVENGQESGLKGVPEHLRNKPAVPELFFSLALRLSQHVIARPRTAFLQLGDLAEEPSLDVMQTAVWVLQVGLLRCSCHFCSATLAFHQPICAVLDLLSNDDIPARETSRPSEHTLDTDSASFARRSESGPTVGCHGHVAPIQSSSGLFCRARSLQVWGYAEQP